MIFQIQKTVAHRTYFDNYSGNVRLDRWVEVTKYKLLGVPLVIRERAISVE